MTAKILIVDDERLIRWSLRQQLEAAGWRVSEAETGAEAVERAREGVDAVLLDFKLPDTDGLDVLRQIKAIDADVPVLLMTAHSTIETAVDAMKQGAYHYATKPLNFEEVCLLVGNALETRRLRREVKSLRADERAPYGFERLVGQSPAMKQVMSLLARVATSPASTVLLTGESGTGKDVAAKVIHYNSDRASFSFQNITCSALPENLLESELFGHERGAFTDAKAMRKGLLELADGGTVFLDEVGEIAPGLQAKLLRFLEDRAFKRVGGSSDVTVDVRIIAATNRDLRKEVESGRFREDLFYRLHVVPIEMPALRDRVGDVPLLAQHWVSVFDREFRKRVTGLTPAAVKLLESHAWPGNVRELRNSIERAVLLTDREMLGPEDFPLLAGGRPSLDGFKLPPGGVDFEALERELVVQALARADGNQTKAAQLLGMKRDQIRYRMEKFGLTRPGDA